MQRKSCKTTRWLRRRGGGQTLRICVKLRNGCGDQGGQTLSFLNLRNGCDDHGKGTLRNDGCGDPEAKTNKRLRETTQNLSKRSSGYKAVDVCGDSLLKLRIWCGDEGGET